MQLTFEDLKSTSFYDPAFSIMAKNVEVTNILTEEQQEWLTANTKSYDLSRVKSAIELLEDGDDRNVDFRYLFHFRDVVAALYQHLKMHNFFNLKELIVAGINDSDFWRAYYRLVLFLRANNVNLGKFPTVCESITNMEKRACELRASAAKSTKMLTAFGVFSDSEFVKVRITILSDFLCGRKDEPECLIEYEKKFSDVAVSLREWYQWLHSSATLQDVVNAFVLEEENVALFPDKLRKSFLCQILDILSILGDEGLKYRYFTAVIIKSDVSVQDIESAFKVFKETLNECNEDSTEFEEQFMLLQHVRKGLCLHDKEKIV